MHFLRHVKNNDLSASEIPIAGIFTIAAGIFTDRAGFFTLTILNTILNYDQYLMGTHVSKVVQNSLGIKNWV